jgi:PleD family two-component response regulator
MEVAYQRAEPLRNEVSNTVREYGGVQLKTSFSAGVAGCPVQGDTSDATLNAADKALYQAKNGGRNRVVIYVSPEPQKDEV